MALTIRRALDGNVQVAWPAAGAGGALEAGPNVTATNWQAGGGAVVDAGARFFRLKFP